MIVDSRPPVLNAFCVDLEEWFHICDVQTPYSDPATWDGARHVVVRNTERLMQLLEETGTRATFLTVGWVAERNPDLIRRLARAGHEIGCHGYWHRLVYSVTPAEFEDDLKRSLKVLRGLTDQPVNAFRAPGFSMRRDCFWAYPILRRNGIEVDVSIVPASRSHGGIAGFVRDPFLLRLAEGDVRCYPVSVMGVAGRLVPFSGGGYLRLMPMWLVKRGFRQNHRQGRPVMSYIHPREIDPQQPRMQLPALTSFRYYVNVAGTLDRLRELLRTYRFTTVAEVLRGVARWPEYELAGSDIVPAATSVPVGSGPRGAGAP
jgi:polysaccharide deacetylase family protein (PEP-CTERM system associated)